MTTDTDIPLQRGFFEGLWDRFAPRTPVFRFLTFVRPYARLVAGGSLAGVLKFVLPLAFPLAFKYIFDVILVPQPKLDRYDLQIDRWCTELARTLGLHTDSYGKLAALAIAMVALFVVQAIATY